jgi:hypothetical protein
MRDFDAGRVSSLVVVVTDPELNVAADTPHANVAPQPVRIRHRFSYVPPDAPSCVRPGTVPPGSGLVSQPEEPR